MYSKREIIDKHKLVFNIRYCPPIFFQSWKYNVENLPSLTPDSIHNKIFENTPLIDSKKMQSLKIRDGLCGLRGPCNKQTCEVCKQRWN